MHTKKFYNEFWLHAVHVQSFCHIPFLHKFLQDPAHSLFEISQFDEQLLNNRTAKHHFSNIIKQTLHFELTVHMRIKINTHKFE